MPGEIVTTLDTPNFIPPTIGEPTPPVAAPVIEKTAEQLRLDALEAQLQASQASNQQLTSSLQLLMQRPAQQAQSQPQAMPEFNLDGLADPVAAPKDFMTGLQNRIRQREGQMAQTITSAITTQVSRGAALDSLYNGFRHAHPELAKKQGLLQGVTTLEFQRLQQQGIDPAILAAQNPDSLIGAIAQRMHTELGTTPAVPGAQSNPQQQTQHPQTLGAPVSAARVAGIQGGTQTPQRGAAAPAPLPGFTDQIKAQQKKMGLY